MTSLLTIDDVATRLHKSVRWLQDHLKRNPCGRMAGKTRLFTEADFQALINSLPKPEAQQCRSNSLNRVKDGPRTTVYAGRISESPLTALQALVTKPQHGKSVE